MKWIITFAFALSLTVGKGQNPGYIHEVLQAVEDRARQTGNLQPDSLASLPIGLVKVIGGRKYIIAIDSAKFTPNGATFSAYMGVELPNAEGKILFAAKNIPFNPAGVMGGNQAKLQLVSRQMVNMGPNHYLELPDDGSNFVEWDCNGFQSVQLHGRFHFRSDILIPADPENDSTVTADFQRRIYDLQNIMTSISFTPFSVNGMQDVKFEVENATLDMSDHSNPIDFSVPPHYQGTIQNTGNLWRGFYLERLTITLPPQFDRPEGPIKLSAQNMIIDDAGITGVFEAINIISVDGGRMGAWPFSVERISASLFQNDLVGGSLDGQIVIPGLKNKRIDYTASLSKNITTQQLDYLFAISAPDTATLAGFGAQLDIDPTSQLVVESVADEFRPRLILNGKVTVEKPWFKLDQLTFQQLTLVPDDPWITDGVFSLTSTEENNISRFPVQLDRIQLAISGFHEPILDIDASMNLGQSEGNQMSVEGGVQMTVQVGNDAEGKQDWALKDTRIKRIHLDVQTSAVKVRGTIYHFRNDPVFGQGFQGQLAMEIGDVLPEIGMSGIFGKVDGYRYWSIDASVPVNINMGNITLTQINGGVSDHMEGTKSPQQLIADIAMGSQVRQTYVPNDSAGLEFRAGVAFQYLNESILNGDVMFSVGFNSYGGLSHVNFLGDAYLMAPRDQRNAGTNRIRGTVAVNYDNNAKIFDAFANVNANFSNKVVGNLWSKMYFSPNLWYTHVGRASNPCSLQLLGLATVDGYFMVGEHIEPMPPPPSYMTQAIGAVPNQRDANRIESGNGIATGMRFDAGFGNSIDLTENFGAYWYGYVGAGFDMTLFKYPTTNYCEGGPQDFGMNNWFLTGQLYAYINLGVGVSGRALGQDFDLTIFDAEVAALLQGHGPNPTYATAQLHMSATILSVIDISFDTEVEVGQKCTIRS